MSTSDLYILNGKSTRHLAEFRNGWGSAPVAWDYLGEKYIEEKPVYSMAESHIKKVWALASDERLEDFEKVVLMMTFDGAFIPLKFLEEAGQACETFGAKSEDGKRVNHWSAIGAALRATASMKFHHSARGVVLSCTSVNDPWIGASPKMLAEAWSVYKS